MKHSNFFLLFMLQVRRKGSIEEIPNLVGGIETDIENWPFIAFIEYSIGGKVHTGCSGTLLSAQTILTAAHCLDDYTLYKTLLKLYTINAFMGSNNITESTMIREVIDYQTHFEYDLHLSKADIGVAFLERPVVFSNTVKKTVLRPFPIVEGEGVLLAAGWRTFSVTLNSSPSRDTKLFYEKQTYIPQQECENYLQHPLVDGTICAGQVKDNRYHFGGDSGGPLITVDGSLQIGLVSYKSLNHLGVTIYTSIPHYFPWIKNTQKQLYTQYCGKTNIVS